MTMSGYSTIQSASEEDQAMSRGFGGTNQQTNSKLADTQPSQEFEIARDGPEDHEGDLFFYKFDTNEEFRRLEMMQELEKRHACHQQSEEDDGDDEGMDVDEGETMSFSRLHLTNHLQRASPEYAKGSHQEAEDERPALWGSFDWRVGIAEYVLKYRQKEDELLSPERAAQVDQVLFQTFPGLRQYYEDHPEEYLVSLDLDLQVEE
jgi:hypothetical protein